MEEKKLRDLIAQMTIKEKVQMLSQKDGRYGKCERLNIAGINPQDNPRGGQDYFRLSKAALNDDDYHPVAYPCTTNIGMSWDTHLSYEIGQAMAKASKANKNYIHCLNRPGVNIKRSPLCGRNFEYFSEDPLHAGKMAAAYIQGVQSENVSACLKHYVANNQEFERMTTNAIISERALREIYLRVFEIAIKKGNPWMMMTSYNRVNGEWVHSNPHLMNILRDEFHYEGVVVSDYLAIHQDKVKAHQNRLDIEMAPVHIHEQELLEAIAMGKVKESQIDESILRILKLYFKLKETEGEKVDINLEEEHQKARIAASESMVLLENDGLLPLQKENQERILVAGALAKDPSYMGGGSAHMNGYKVDIPFEEIQKYQAHVSYTPAYELHEGFPPVDVVNEKLIQEAVKQAEESDIVLFFGGYGYCYEGEGWDRSDILLPESQRLALEALMKTKAKIVLILSAGSAIDLSAYKKKVSAIIYTGYAGEAFGGAISDVLFGLKEPGGRLTETFPMKLEDTPAFLNFGKAFTDHADIMYGEGVFVGYRWYEARKMDVAYPFGHGLSYTTFDIKDFHVSQNTMHKNDKLQVSVTICNTGSRAGSQVLQLYVRNGQRHVISPEKELRAFTKVHLHPGEEKTVSMELDHHAFEYYSETQDRWILEKGDYELVLATSAETIEETWKITFIEGDPAYIYNQNTPLIWFIKNPRFFQILKEHFPAEKQYFFDVTKSKFTTLLYGVPFFRLSEPTMGEPIFTVSEINNIINEMNEIE